MNITGRGPEITAMKKLLSGKNPELLAVIGRRRVGKTYLIREVYKEQLAFEMTGLNNADLSKQLVNFQIEIQRHFPGEDLKEPPNDWLRAFGLLSTLLEKYNQKNKPVVFFDELPWMATKRSGFTEALGHWWNSWASRQSIVVVICGSAASWMLQHVVNAKGGLHNRITKLITLLPFNLSETKEFLESRQVKLSFYQVVQVYMSIGGIPHYLKHLEKGKSATQNIQEICFSKDGILKNEFANLYPALFDNAENHIKVIRALASKNMGMDRQDILKATKISDGGQFTTLLNELETSGFIGVFEPMEKKKKGTLYRLTDEYSLFYLRFMSGASRSGPVDWNRVSQSQAYKTWCGYAFENLCMKHIDCIKEALGISGVETEYNSYLHKKNKAYESGFQIDLLLDRKDDVINICEMKFYSDAFVISSDYARKLRTKKEGLKRVTGTKKLVQLTFITTYGLTENIHSLDLVENEYSIEIFF